MLKESRDLASDIKSRLFVVVRNTLRNGLSIWLSIESHTFNDCPKGNNVKILHKIVNMPPICT